MQYPPCPQHPVPSMPMIPTAATVPAMLSVLMVPMVPRSIGMHCIPLFCFWVEVKAALRSIAVRCVALHFIGLRFGFG